jgi:hypothetical protein
MRLAALGGWAGNIGHTGILSIQGNESRSKEDFKLSEIFAAQPRGLGQVGLLTLEHSGFLIFSRLKARCVLIIKCIITNTCKPCRA